MNVFRDYEAIRAQNKVNEFQFLDEITQIVTLGLMGIKSTNY